jgi:hypothetical protein
MAFWITTHWPRKKNQPVEEPRYGVWVRDSKRHLIDRVSPRDLVFIYESRSGPTVVRTNPGGSARRIPRRRGREGIVALVEVTEAAYQPEDSQPEQYTNGSTAWWRYCAPTRSVNSAGFIPRRSLNSLLGYAENYVFHGFGEEHSGLKEITRDLFSRLFSRFSAAAGQDEKRRIARAPRHSIGDGGEGPEHLALKRRIAEDPAGVLGESGLRFWREEWPLPTGDRIDLVLKDALDRFVAVEVEVRCEASEMAGPLQCMKYRALLSYFFNRPLTEIRCILVAHSIHAGVRGRCDVHSIETKTVSITQKPAAKLFHKND